MSCLPENVSYIYGLLMAQNFKYSLPELPQTWHSDGRNNVLYFYLIEQPLLDRVRLQDFLCRTV